MYKKKSSSALINILLAVIFIIGFYIGGTSVPADRIGLFALSANASMVISEEDGRLLSTNAAIVSNILPVKIDFIKQPEPESTPAPTPFIDYNTQVPVMANKSDGAVRIINDTSYEVNVQQLLSEPVRLREGDINVLILHTHTTEAYTRTADNSYEEADSYRTQNAEQNVIAVGSVIEAVLSENGIGVVHDKTYHDYPSYSGSYRRALDTININTEKYSGITLVLDVHRDAISHENGTYMKTQAEIDGEKCAQAMLVVGSDYSGLEHEGWRDNLTFALKLQKIMCERYPGLARDVHLREERFNGNAREGAMIIEVGSNGNTLEEAKKCAYYVAQCVVDLIKECQG